jgi:hypothetical protein
MMVLLIQTDRFLHLQATLLKSVRLHPHRSQQLARSQKPGVDGKPPQKIVLRNCVEGRERKLDGAAEKVGRICAHLSACLPFYHERLLKLANSLQHKTIDSFSTIFFGSGL